MKIHVLKLKLRKLHKYLGFTFSFFILYLTITGLLLMYPQTFNIDKMHINNQLILKKYNMDGYNDVYKLDNKINEIIVIKKSIYMDGIFLDNIEENILSITYEERRKLLYLITMSKVYFYELEKDLDTLEILNTYNIENTKNITKVGKNILNNNIVFRSKSFIYNLKEGSFNKKEAINNNENYIWSDLKIANRKLSKKHLFIHQGEGVQMLRIITELHNGRFFGSIYTLILFISSLSLIFLTLSSFIFATNIFKKK